MLLDEQANGLDPEGIRWMRELLQRLADEGRTVLISSHLLAEMEALAHDVVIVAAGRMIRQGSVADVVAAMPGSDRVEVITPEPEKLGGVVTSQGPNALLVKEMLPAATAALTAGVSLHRVHAERPDLESAFLELTQGRASIR